MSRLGGVIGDGAATSLGGMPLANRVCMRRLLTLAILAQLATFAGACSSGGGSPDGGAGTSGTAGNGGGGSGGTTGVAGNADAGGGGAGATTGSAGTSGINPACAAATENAACTDDGVVCGSCTDVCQFCNTLRCVSGRWQRMEAAPAPCFMCGPSLRCQGYVQYCEVTMGGAQGSAASHRCSALPTACKTTPTCACLQTQGVAGSASCTMAGQGDVTVTLPAPGGGSDDAGAPLTTCPGTRPSSVGAACQGSFSCSYNDSCSACGCCSWGYGCSGSKITFLGYSDGCTQVCPQRDAATD